MREKSMLKDCGQTVARQGGQQTCIGICKTDCCGCQPDGINDSLFLLLPLWRHQSYDVTSKVRDDHPYE